MRLPSSLSPAVPWPAWRWRHALLLALLFVALAAWAQSGQHAYVPNEDSGTISVSDTASDRSARDVAARKAITDIAVGAAPWGVVIP